MLNQYKPFKKKSSLPVKQVKKLSQFREKLMAKKGGRGFGSEYANQGTSRGRDADTDKRVSAARTKKAETDKLKKLSPSRSRVKSKTTNKSPQRESASSTGLGKNLTNFKPRPQKTTVSEQARKDTVKYDKNKYPIQVKGSASGNSFAKAYKDAVKKNVKTFSWTHFGDNKTRSYANDQYKAPTKTAVTNNRTKSKTSPSGFSYGPKTTSPKSSKKISAKTTKPANATKNYGKTTTHTRKDGTKVKVTDLTTRASAADRKKYTRRRV